MHMSREHHLWISPKLRSAIRSLQACFLNEYWQNKFESVDDEIRSKYPALVEDFNKTCEEVRLKHPVLVPVLYKILDGLGTTADFVTMREACVPTEWLVRFLSVWKQVSEKRQGGETLVSFIQGVIDKVGNIYILLIDATGEHHEWTQLVCMSSLLLRLKTLSD